MAEQAITEEAELQLGVRVPKHLTRATTVLVLEVLVMTHLQQDRGHRMAAQHHRGRLTKLTTQHKHQQVDLTMRLRRACQHLHPEASTISKAAIRLMVEVRQHQEPALVLVQ